MNELQNIIKFYRDCYQTDLKGVRIRNFISKQCEKRFIPDINHFFFSRNAEIPVNTEWAKEVDKILYFNSKEKSLFAGSFFVKGKLQTLGRKTNAFVPLYIHELDLILEKEVFLISIKETFINPDFIEIVNNLNKESSLSYDELSSKIPENPFGFDNHILLQNFFETHLPKWNLKDLSHYKDHNFDFNKYYNRIKSSKKDALKIYACLMFGIFKKPIGSMGVLSELNILSNNSSYSKLLNQLFKIEKFNIENIQRRDIFLPTTLSEKQESTFFASDSYPITQIVGPPGTGKSYTISAIAIDAICNNKKVLILTRNVQASQVITNIIEKEFGLKKTIIKAFNQVYKRSLISKLNKAIKVDARKIETPKQLTNKISKLIRQINKTETDILSAGINEYKWGEFYAQNQDDFFSIFKDKWIQYRKYANDPIWKLNDKLKTLREEKARLVRKYIRVKLNYELRKIVRRKKVDFLKLINALKENNLTLRDKKINKLNYDLILSALPLWTSTTKEISKCLPLNKELFDLVIFDEASQCDIASAIPSLCRAKKMIVVGDPHQLRHVSFLSNKKQDELLQRNEVVLSIPNYRKDSLIDWTNKLLSNPDQTTLLNEHFRSKTDIIQFSNNKFYENQLRLIRSNPISDSSSSIEFIQVNGKRNKQGVNEIEIEEIISTVKTIIKKHGDSITSIIPKIGISSPYTAQVKSIKSALSDSIPYHLIKRHEILVGTPFHFQGEERDIMMISFCIDKDSHFGSINYLNRRDVFNVLITRARNRQIIFTSIQSSDLPSHSLLKEYLGSSDSILIENKKDLIYDDFFNEVNDFLDQSGINVIQQNTIVSGIPIDLVVLHNNKCYCIDLIGYPGEFEDQFSLEDLRILNRINTPVFFLPFSSWYLDYEKMKKNLLYFLGKNHR